MKIDIKRVFMGAAMISAGVTGLALSLSAPKSVQPEQVIAEEIPVDEEETDFVLAKDDVAEENASVVEPTEEVFNSVVRSSVTKTEVSGFIAPEVMDATLPPIKTPPPQSRTIVEFPSEVEPTLPGKLLSPKDQHHLREINDILSARAMTKNWDIQFPKITQSEATWRRMNYTCPPGMTMDFVLFKKTGEPVLYGKNSLILDTLSNPGPKTAVRRKKILDSVTLPSDFPPSSTPIGAGPDQPTLRMFVRGTRAYIAIPTKLILADGHPKVDLSFRIATTSGTPLPQPDFIYRMAFDAAREILITARATKLITTPGLLIDL